MNVGDPIELTCEGKTVQGELMLVSPNGKSLMVKLPEGLRTPSGLYLNFLALLQIDGGYRELMNGWLVDVATPKDA